MLPVASVWPSVPYATRSVLIDINAETKNIYSSPRVFFTPAFHRISDRTLSIIARPGLLGLDRTAEIAPYEARKHTCLQ